MDIARKSIAPGELKRFAQKFGALALMDRESVRYRETGMAYLSMGDGEAFERLLADQQLLTLPLARAGTQLSVGIDEDAWRAWLAPET